MEREFVARIGCMCGWVKKFDVLCYSKYMHRSLGSERNSIFSLSLTHSFSVRTSRLLSLSLSLSVFVLFSVSTGHKMKTRAIFSWLHQAHHSIGWKWNKFWISNNYRHCQLCTLVNNEIALEASVRVIFTLSLSLPPSCTSHFTKFIFSPLVYFCHGFSATLNRLYM